MIAGLISFFFIVLPLCFWNFAVDTYELPKVLLFLSIVNISIFRCISIVPVSPLRSKKIGESRSQNIWLVMLVAWLSLASIINGNPNSWFGQQYRYQGMITLFGYLSWYWLVIKKFDQLNKALFYRIMSLGGLVNALFIIAQRMWLGDARLAGNLGNPNFAGGFLALISAFIDNWISLGIMGGAIVLTGSRSALLAFCLIIVCKLWVKLKSKKLFFALFFGIAALAVIWFPHRPASAFDKREVIWQKSLEAIAKKPIFGWGVENFETAFVSTLKENEFELKDIRVDKSHNELLEIGVAGGMPALLSYLGLVTVCALQLWHNRTNDVYFKTLLCLSAFLIISSLNVINITEYLFFYLILGISYTSVNRLAAK